MDNSVYVLFNPFSSAWYTGKNCGRDAICREYEHFSGISRFMAEKSQLPAYRHIRLFPCGLWLLLPVISLKYSSNFELLTLEHDQIRCTTSPLNWPYVKKLVNYEDSFDYQKPANLIVKPSSIASQKMKLTNELRRKKFWKFSIHRKIQRLATIHACRPVDFIVRKVNVWKDGEIVTAQHLSKMHNLGLIAERLGDMRRKAFGGTVALLRIIKKLNPLLLSKIMTKINVLLSGKRKQVATSRFFRVIDSSHDFHHATMNIKIPYIKDLDMLNFVSNILKTQLPGCLAKTTAFRLNYIKNTSPKCMLSNSKIAIKNMFDSTLTCTCSVLQRKLGFVWKGEGHVCIRGSETSLAKAIPCHAKNFETLMIPTANWTIKTLTKEFTRIREKLNVQIDLEDLKSTIEKYYFVNKNFKNLGILMSDFIALKRRLTKYAIFTPLDKEKKDIAVSCCLGYQQRYKNLMQKMSVCFLKQENAAIVLTSDVLNFVERYTYSATTVPRALHKFGILDCHPKASDIANIDKSRPLGSYWKHKMRPLLSLTCKVIMAMLHFLGLDFVGVCSVAAVKSHYRSINEEITNLRSKGKILRVFKYKRDINNFFGNIKHHFIRNAILWLQQKWREKYSRRKYVAVPKYKDRKTGTPIIFSRSWKDKYRNYSDDHKVNVARPHNSKVVAKHWCVLHTDDLDKILKFDLECGALYAG